MVGESKAIVILDDEPERIAAMLPCLANECPEHETVVFDNAPDMIGWLAVHCHKTILICLETVFAPVFRWTSALVAMWPNFYLPKHRYAR